VHMVLDANQCYYWPKYINPITNLSWALLRIGPSMYQPKDLYTTRIWFHPRITYSMSHHPLTPLPTNMTLHTCRIQTYIFLSLLIHTGNTPTHCTLPKRVARYLTEDPNEGSIKCRPYAKQLRSPSPPYLT